MSDNDWVPPEIDYLAKDYASFRRLMLDHLSLLVPDWKEQSPADLGHAIVEALAYAADYLSYYQDAVASEAYLGTARLRRSVRRHVRPLEYYLQEGCNARAWVQVQVSANVFLVRGTQLLTRLAGRETGVIMSDEAAYQQALQDGVTVFETMHHIYLRPDHNLIPIIQRDKESCLPEGSTNARLPYRWKDEKSKDRTSENLKVGDVLVLEELCNPQTDVTHPEHRHAVRLTAITPPAGENDSWIEIEWAAADALPFDLCIAPTLAGHPESSPSVALGNIVLADHGRRIRDEELPVVQPGERYRPRLRYPGLTFAAPYDSHLAKTQPAYQTMQYQPYEAFGWVRLREYAAHFAQRTKWSRDPRLLQDLDKNIITISGMDLDKDIIMMMHYDWTLRRDLLNSGQFDRDFKVEMEEDGRAYLRFGFERMGKLPDPDDLFVATYRIGNGSQGNVSAETIAHVVDVVEDGKAKRVLNRKIKCVRNPMPARGGRDAEGIQSARLHAPYAYQSRKGCVTEADYAAHASQHPAVAQAVAHMRWIGSRRTVVIYAQRADGQPVDDDFQQELCDFIEPCRLMGHDVQIRAPRFVSLQISLCLHLEPHAHSLVLRQQLERVFSDRLSTDGEPGSFYPDNFRFGQPVHQSQVIARAMALPGIKRVEVTRFRRADGDGDVLEIPIGPGEIARLGRIDFDFKGGL